MFFVTVLFLMVCCSCSNKPQTRGEAYDNLLGWWVNKDAGNTLFFLDVSMLAGTYLVDDISKDNKAPVTRLYTFEYAGFDDLFFLSLEQKNGNFEIYWVEKVGKRKVVLQNNRDDPNSVIVLTRYNKFKQFIDQRLLNK